MKLTITKIGAAMRQLDSAIHMWSHDADPVSILTLAAASHQVIHDLKTARGLDPLLYDSPIIKEEYRREAINAFKKDMNFFKHADKDPEGTTEFNTNSIEPFFLFSILGLEYLHQEKSDVQVAFTMWYMLNKPALLNESGAEYLNSALSAELKEELASMSKRDFLRTILAQRARVRANRGTIHFDERA